MLSSFRSELFSPGTARQRQLEEQVEAERLTLLRELRHALANTIECASRKASISESSAGSTGVSSCQLDERDPEVQDLIKWLERCFWHRLRTTARVKRGSSFVNEIDPSLWNFARHFASIGAERDTDEASRKANVNARLAATALDVDDLVFVTKNTGKGLAWLRVALNSKVLDAAVARLGETPHVKSTYYEDGALIRNEEAAAILESILTGLNGLEFNVHIDTKVLDQRRPPPRHPNGLAIADAEARIINNEGSSWSGKFRQAIGKASKALASSEQSKTPTRSSPNVLFSAPKSKFGNANALVKERVSTANNKSLGFSHGSLRARADAKRKMREGESKAQSKIVSVFGSTLEGLAECPANSVLAKMAPSLAVPDLILRCVALLWEGLETGAIKDEDIPRLFTTVNGKPHLNEQVSLLSKSLASMGGLGLTLFARVGVDVSLGEALLSIATSTRAGIPSDQSDTYEPGLVSTLLHLFLRQLPEPLLSPDIVDPMIECLAIESEDAKLRNMTCLTENLPHSHKVVLDLLLALYAKMCSIGNQGELVGAIGPSLSAVLTRPRTPLSNQQQQQRQDSSSQNVKLGSFDHVCSFLIRNNVSIMQPVKQDLAKVREHVATKMNRIRAVHDGFGKAVDMSNKQHCEALTILWDTLEGSSEGARLNVKEEDLIDDGATSASADGDDMKILSSGWLSRGFSSADAAAEFRSGGETALFDLAYFCSKYGVKARQMAGCGSYSFIKVAAHMSLVVADLLAIRARGLGGSAEALERVATKPWWGLLDEKDAIHRVFSMSLLLFDLNFESSQACPEDLTQVLSSSRTLMADLIALEPRNANELWHSWIQFRTEHLLRKEQIEEQKLGSKDRNANLAQVKLSVGASSLEQTEEHDDLNITQDEESEGEKEQEEVGGEDGANQASELGQLIPQLLEPSSILTPGSIGKLEASLPGMYQGYDWELVFSSERDGEDINEFHQKAKEVDATLLIIRDTEGYRFGGFSAVKWEIQSSYFGTGESFLFTLSPDFSVYPWSRANSYFMLCNEDSLAFGGGEFGIYLDEDLQSGSSEPCKTFSSPCLASSPDFNVSAIELWAFRMRRRSASSS